MHGWCELQGASVISRSEGRPYIAAGIPAATEQTECGALSLDTETPCSQWSNITGVHCAHQYVLFAIDGTWQEAREIHKVSQKSCSTNP